MSWCQKVRSAEERCITHKIGGCPAAKSTTYLGEVVIISSKGERGDFHDKSVVGGQGIPSTAKEVPFLLNAATGRYDGKCKKIPASKVNSPPLSFHLTE